MSWRTELLAQPAYTREGVDEAMRRFGNIAEFEYSVAEGEVGKRPVIPVWYVNVVRKGDDLSDPQQWVQAYRMRREVGVLA